MSRVNKKHNYFITKMKIGAYDYYRVHYRHSTKSYNIQKLGDAEAYRLAEETGEFMKTSDNSPENQDLKRKDHTADIVTLKPFDVKSYFAKDVSFTGMLCGSTKSGKTTLLIKIYEEIKNRFDMMIIFSVSSHKEIYDSFKKCILIPKFDEELVNYLYTLNRYLAEKNKEMLKILIILDDIVTEKSNKTLLNMVCTMRNSAITTLISVQSPNMINDDNKGNFNFIILKKLNDSQKYNDLIKLYFDGDILQRNGQEIPEELLKTVIRKKEFIRKFLREKTSNYNFLCLDILGGHILYENLLED